jgi:hypothetical protein
VSELFGGSIYDTGRKRRLLLWTAGIIAVIAVILLAYKLLQPAPISVSWDSPSVQPGGEAILRVSVTNTTNAVVKDVIVYVKPISPYLSVYSKQALEQNSDSSVFRIPSLAPGDTAIATYLVKVGTTAYAGDHSVLISVAFPGATYTTFSRIRVM